MQVKQVLERQTAGYRATRTILTICEEEAMDEKKKAIKEAFKDGDWVFGIGEHKGCSQVFTGSGGDFQPFDFLNDYEPSHFRFATEEEKAEAIQKLGKNPYGF